ncbi:protein-tyrosine phosphatase family protein [Aporhodopirellula aestuarii]|uniref:Cytochrome C n=1 Tax=Aporhodopirellula aestuarii TaxID=2950107 RepID=A0ABT0U1V6_9BACT|nr:hypothetical protein [Aporhodopirellula aestuarii]MCM2370847.1 hypothetical protein [Aporhodopirellula aestuarii]
MNISWFRTFIAIVFLSSPAFGETPTDSTATDSNVPHNLLALPGGIYCGAQPEGDDQFKSLAELGVRTVVSVDGAIPDLASAEAHGLRYIHIPIGYDGVDEQAGLSIARLVREIKGPIYVHCHHGQHRGPAAAAIACIAGGFADNDSATEILRRAGTSDNYAGLWRDVAAYVPPPEDAEFPELVSVAPVDSFVTAMANTGVAMEHLRLCQKADWSSPEQHPDLVPTQVALLVREGLHESQRHAPDDVDARFRESMQSSNDIAAQLQAALQANRTGDADVLIGRLETSCSQCHRDFRN